MSTEPARRGRFICSRVPYETMPQGTRRAFEAAILVHQANLHAASDEYIIDATSPLFDVVPIGAPVPFYSIIFHVDDAGRITLTAKRNEVLTAAMIANPPPIAETFTVKATVSIADKVKALQREIGFRKRVYPRSVADGKMKQSEADHQLAVMEAILADYAPAPLL